MNDSVSCVVLNYNDADTTIEFIERIKNYTAIAHIVVVDNNSSDDSFIRIKEHTNDKIKLIRTEKNGGYGAGNNFGVKYAYETFNSKYVLVSNPDVIFSNQCAENLRSALEQDDKIAAASAVQLTANGEVIRQFAWKLLPVWKYIFSAGELLQRKRWDNYGMEWLNDAKSKGPFKTVDCIPGAMLMVSAKAFLDFGGYDERNFLYAEEAMLARKIKDNGLKTVLLVNDTYIHNHSVSINKSIPKLIKRYALVLDAHYFYISNYGQATGFQKLTAKVFYKLCIFEKIILEKTKNIRRRLKTKKN